METISISLPSLCEPAGGDPDCLLLSKLLEQEGSEDKVWFWSDAEDEGGEPWNMEWGTPRLSLGGTGGNNPPASDRDKLRLGLILSVWIGLWPVVELPSGVLPEVKPSNTGKQMDSWESLLGGGGIGSGVGQKWMGAVLRRLKTVLGLGIGLTTALLLVDSELASIASTFETKLFLDASEFMGPVD